MFTANGGGTVVIRVTDKKKKTSDATINVTPTGANVDYTVDSVSSAGPYLAGNAINGTFTLENVGSANGSQPVSWSAYVSTNAALDAGDTLVASGTTGHLDSHVPTPVSIVPITANWPNTIGATYYLIVSVAAADDTGPTINTGASPGCVLSAPDVDYTVTLVGYTGGTTAAVLGNVSGASFQFRNKSSNNGSQPVIWTAYASASGFVDGAAVVMASGISQPLPASTTSGTITITGGKWPKHYGTYDLVVLVSAPGEIDTDSTNDSKAYGTLTFVGYVNESEPNNDAAGLSSANVQDLGITLQPGMSVLVTRILADVDTHDVFAFNTGSAASVSLYMSWAVSQNVTLNIKKDTPIVTTVATTTTAAGTSLSLGWNVDVAPIRRWIDVANPLGETAYTLIITGN
jgi:hypothetical protein